MRARLLTLLDALRSSFWFVPALLAGAAALLALALIQLDVALGSTWAEGSSWLYSGGPDGASALLSMAAGSLITVAGTVFSITIAALTLASTQFGPRLLRNFMRDTSNQVVLGIFTSGFVYCLLVLRTVRSEEEGAFVPHVAVSGAILLTFVGIGALIFFIHHMATSIQAPSLIAFVGRDLDDAIDRLFPQSLGYDPPAPPDDAQMPPRFVAGALPIPSSASGYVQAIDEEALLALAIERDLVLALDYHPGEFVVEEAPLALAWPAERVDAGLADAVNATFVLGDHRTSVQDVEHDINQIAEVAVRAMSPAINDPYTCMMCVDRLGVALCRLAEITTPSPFRHDAEGRLRVIVEPVTFPSLLDAAYGQIRLYGAANPAVLCRMLEVIGRVATHARLPLTRAALLRHAQAIVTTARAQVKEPTDVQQVERRFRAVARLLADAEPEEALEKARGEAQAARGAVARP